MDDFFLSLRLEWIVDSGEDDKLSRIERLGAHWVTIRADWPFDPHPDALFITTAPTLR